MLVRNGVGKIRLIDFDQVTSFSFCIQNLIASYSFFFEPKKWNWNKSNKSNK